MRATLALRWAAVEFATPSTPSATHCAMNARRFTWVHLPFSARAARARTSVHVARDDAPPERVAVRVQMQRVGAKELGARHSARVEHRRVDVDEVDLAFGIGVVANEGVRLPDLRQQ